MPHSGATRILAVGDSNTFGMYEDGSQSYPAQLQRLWQARHADHPIDIINLGYPGASSYRVASITEQVLETVSPDIVLLCVGINDVFGSPAHDEAPQTRQRVSTVLRGLLPRPLRRRSPLPDSDVPLAHGPTVTDRALLQWREDVEDRHRAVLAFKSVNSDPTAGSNDAIEVVQFGGQSLVMVAAADGSEAQADNRGFQHIRANVAYIEALARRYGAALYLLTYPASGGFYKGCNRELVNAARASTTIQLIDIASQFQSDRSLAEDTANLFYDDLHAKAKAYSIIAGTVADRLAGDILNSPVKRET